MAGEPTLGGDEGQSVFAPGQNGTVRLLSAGLDSVYGHLVVPTAPLEQVVSLFEAGGLPDLTAMGRTARSGYQARLRPGLDVELALPLATHLARGIGVKLGPRFLRSGPLEQVELVLLQSVERLGLPGGALHLRRVDIALDVELPGGLPPIDPKCDVAAHAKPWVATGADGSQTLYVGRRASATGQLRVYDKTRDGRKREFWRGVWGVTDREDLTVVRFEFEVGPRLLRRFRITTMSDLVARQGTLLDYLTGRWVRLAGPIQGKAKLRPDLPLWAWLRRTIAAESLGRSDVTAVAVVQQPNVPAAVHQAVGVCRQIAIGRGIEQGLDHPASFDAVVVLLRAEYESPQGRARLAAGWQAQHSAWPEDLAAS